MLIADAIVQRLMRRPDHQSIETPFRISHPPSERISIAPGYRIPIALALGAVDICGTALAIVVFDSASITPPAFLATVVMLLFSGQLLGLYGAESTADLRRSATSAVGLTAGFLPGAAVVAWSIGGTAAIWPATMAVACVAAAMVLGRLVCLQLTRRFAGLIIERVLIVGNCVSGEQLVSAGWAFDEQVKIVGQIAVGDGETCVRQIGRIDAEVEMEPESIEPLSCPKCGIDRIVIIKANLDDRQLAVVVRSLEAWSVPIHLLTDLPGANCLPHETEWVVRHAPLRPGARLAKRLFDIVASAVLLILTAPLLLLIGLLIRLETPGPVLFRQVRLGRDNRPFTVVKFRTMRVDAHATDGSIQARRNDERVTRVGAILRQTSLDELPQLWNVFTGTMSLVGPRPHPTPLNHRFLPLIEHYAARHRVVPGITGWAQVNGYRGETPSVEHMQGRIDYDLEYIRDCSVGFDLWILLRTVVAVVINRNAY